MDVKIYVIWVLVCVGILSVIFRCFPRLNPFSISPMDRFNRLEGPVVLFGKDRVSPFNRSDYWALILKDANGVTHEFSNGSTIANVIGENYRVGDIIKDDMTPIKESDNRDYESFITTENNG